MQPLKHRAKGKWRGILPALGIPDSYLTGKHGPCPLCGGKDRWRWDNKEGCGTWICSKCGAGDGISLVMLKHGIQFRDAVKHIDQLVDIAPLDKVKIQRTDKDKREAMNKLWRSGIPITTTDPVGIYLSKRCGITTYPPCLRFVPRVKYYDERPSWHPVMVAMVMAPNGSPAILHRTYLTTDGRKAAVASPRRMMSGTVTSGSAVRLMEPTDMLGIAEGIETAFSAHALFGVPCWAALNAGMMMTWQPPETVERIVIFGDDDPGFAGQAAAYGLARRISGNQWKVEVRIANQAYAVPTGTDWNDIFQEGAKS